MVAASRQNKPLRSRSNPVLRNWWSESFGENVKENMQNRMQFLQSCILKKCHEGKKSYVWSIFKCIKKRCSIQFTFYRNTSWGPGYILVNLQAKDSSPNFACSSLESWLEIWRRPLKETWHAHAGFLILILEIASPPTREPIIKYNFSYSKIGLYHNDLYAIYRIFRGYFFLEYILRLGF